MVPITEAEPEPVPAAQQGGIIAEDILDVLNLKDIANNKDITVTGSSKGPGFSVRTIQLSRRVNVLKAPKGVEIIQNELGNFTGFDLLYNEKDQLIAVFPAAEQAAENTSEAPRYFNFSGYYFEIPGREDKEAFNKWKKYVREKVSNDK